MKFARLGRGFCGFFDWIKIVQKLGEVDKEVHGIWWGRGI